MASADFSRTQTMSTNWADDVEEDEAEMQRGGDLESKFAHNHRALTGARRTRGRGACAACATCPDICIPALGSPGRAQCN